MSFFGELFGNFTGGRERDDVRRGAASGRGNIDAGVARARGDYAEGQGYLDEAGQVIDPYERGGREGFDAYRSTLGLGDPALRKSTEEGYFSNGVNNAIMDRVTKANTRQQTGRGMGNSGAATQSLTNALLDRWGQFQDRLKGVGDTGFAAAGQMSGLKTAKAGLSSQLGDMEFGAGQQRAAIDMSEANAIAQSRNRGINNLFQLGSIAAQGARAFAGGGGR